jgi:hypothetical protein
VPAWCLREAVAVLSCSAVIGRGENKQSVGCWRDVALETAKTAKYLPCQQPLAPWQSALLGRLQAVPRAGEASWTGPVTKSPWQQSTGLMHGFGAACTYWLVVGGDQRIRSKPACKRNLVPDGSWDQACHRGLTLVKASMVCIWELNRRKWTW